MPLDKKNLIQRLALEIEDIRQDIAGLSRIPRNCKIADFGCGDGYTTLAIMLELDASECIGVDHYAQHQLDEIKDAIINDSLPSDLQEPIQKLTNGERYPTFLREDIVIGESLPRNLDLAYCKKLLGNIYTGEYNNSIKADDGVNRAISNIIKTIKLGGQLCLVEKDTKDFTPYLKQHNLEFLRMCRIRRNTIDILRTERTDSSAQLEQLFIYHYRKI